MQNRRVRLDAMTVYVEVVFLNNLLVDLALLWVTETCFARKPKKLRCLLSAVVGAAVAVAYPIVGFEWRIVIRAILAPLMCLILRKPLSAKEYFKTLAVFALATFFAGGVVEGFDNLLGIEISGYLVLGEVAVGVLVLAIVLNAFVRRRAAVRRMFKDVRVGGSRVAKGLCDSGNTLTDDVSGKPVMLVTAAFAADVNAHREGFIEVVTAVGKNELPLVCVGDIEVDGTRYEDALAAVAVEEFDGYELVLNCTMFGG